jgi:hypothetical protein
MQLCGAMSDRKKADSTQVGEKAVIPTLMGGIHCELALSPVKCSFGVFGGLLLNLNSGTITENHEI